jgi:hypothetical protein
MPLPSADKVVGSTGHTADHNSIVTEVAAVQAEVDAVSGAIPSIKGEVSSESALPVTGAPGDHYIVGNAGSLYGWNPTTSAWVDTGATILGPQGVQGSPGTIVGILASDTADPPAGTAAGTLWWRPAPGETPPAPTLTPGFIGATGGYSAASTLSISPPPGVNTGDVGVLMVLHAGNSAPTATPAGWTLIRTDAQSTNFTAYFYTKNMSSGDGNVSFAASAKKSYVMQVYRNVTLTPTTLTPHKEAYFDVVTASSTVAAPTVTPTVPSIVIGFWAERQGTAPTTSWDVDVPAAFTRAGDGRWTELTGSAIASVVGGRNMTVVTSGAQSPGNWVRSGGGSASTSNGVWTFALAKAT